MKLEELRARTLAWSDARGILTNGKITTQALKLVSEMGELADNAAKNNLEAMKDDIGDCLVVLTNLAALAGTSLEECWEVAYNDIKDRKGFLNANGNFIKDTDPNYEKLYADYLWIKGNSIEDNPNLETLSLFPDEESMIIAEVVGNHVQLDLSTYEIGIVTYGNTSVDFKFRLYPGQKVPEDLPSIFRGKTVAQFKAYLNTIGEII